MKIFFELYGRYFINDKTFDGDNFVIVNSKQNTFKEHDYIDITSVSISTWHLTSSSFNAHYFK